MITPDVLESLLNGMVEKIPLCSQLVAAGRCQWDCCQYEASYLLFLPGELESARALNYETDQYRIIEANYHGGVKAVPRNMGCCVDPALGRRRYKSLDCRLFPYWFQIEAGRVVLLEGMSCPIVRGGHAIAAQRSDAVRVAGLLSQDADVAAFLSEARMVNYRVLNQEAGAGAQA